MLKKVVKKRAKPYGRPFLIIPWLSTHYFNSCKLRSRHPLFTLPEPVITKDCKVGEIHPPSQIQIHDTLFLHSQFRSFFIVKNTQLTAPPVIQVVFESGTANAEDVTDLVFAGQ